MPFCFTKLLFLRSANQPRIFLINQSHSIFRFAVAKSFLKVAGGIVANPAKCWRSK